MHPTSGSGQRPPIGQWQMSGVVQTTRRLSLAGRNEPVAELAQVAPQGSFWHAPAVRGHEMLQLAQTSALARCICEIESSANGS